MNERKKEDQQLTITVSIISEDGQCPESTNYEYRTQHLIGLSAENLYTIAFSFCLRRLLQKFRVSIFAQHTIGNGVLPN